MWLRSSGPNKGARVEVVKADKRTVEYRAYAGGKVLAMFPEDFCNSFEMERKA
jgi:hypothetical protein